MKQQHLFRLYLSRNNHLSGQSQLIAMPLDLPVGEAGNTFEETIHLISNDPDKPTTDLKIKVEYTEDALKPELADFSTTPPVLKKESVVQLYKSPLMPVRQQGKEV
jgi:hypothetical protein